MTGAAAPDAGNALRLQAASGMVQQLRAQLAQQGGGPVDLVETHISWVLLAGQDAWKIKKPLRLDFLDYSTPALRKAGCEEEWRINRRTAAAYYLGVVAVTGTAKQPALGGAGPVLDWALHMRRFPQGSLLADRMDQGTVPEAAWPALAWRIADLHARAAPAGMQCPHGQPAALLQAAEDNFAALLGHALAAPVHQTLRQLQPWSKAQAERWQGLMQQRLQSGMVRECHGDLHLGNLLWIDGEPMLFDAIEFNPSLRWIDIMADMAFLVMDLQYRHRADLGWRVLNQWLERTGDYAGLAMLPFFMVYRALVRAKVAALQAGQCQGARRLQYLQQMRDHVALARQCSQPRGRWLWITHGLSGAGKSTLSLPLLEQTGMIRLRADVERKRLFGLAPEQSSRGCTPEGIYTPQAHARTFDRLATLAQAVLQAGYPVLIDATFLRAEVRARFRQIAQAAGVPFGILAFEAPAEVLRQRVQQRLQAGNDASEAGLAVLEAQMAGQDPLKPEEADLAVRVDAMEAPDWRQLLAARGWRYALD